MLALLASFEDSRPELSVTEMADALGVHKSTASRLAATLERTGFLTRSGRRYRLGVEIIRLGTLALRSVDIVARCSPPWTSCPQLTGETINLAVPAGPDILNVAEVPSTLHPELLGRLDRAPHQAARGGQRQGAAGVRRHPGAGQPGAVHRAHDQLDAGAAGPELAAIRRDGYATAVAELEEGLVAVASPVFGPDGACVAALSVSGPGLPDAARRSWTSSAGSAPDCVTRQAEARPGRASPRGTRNE